MDDGLFLTEYVGEARSYRLARNGAKVAALSKAAWDTESKHRPPEVRGLSNDQAPSDGDRKNRERPRKGPLEPQKPHLLALQIWATQKW